MASSLAKRYRSLDSNQRVLTIIIGISAILGLGWLIFSGPITGLFERAFYNFFPDLKAVNTAETTAFPGTRFALSESITHSSEPVTDKDITRNTYTITVAESGKIGARDVDRIRQLACQALGTSGVGTDMNIEFTKTYGVGPFSYTSNNTTPGTCPAS